MLSQSQRHHTKKKKEDKLNIKTPTGYWHYAVTLNGTGQYLICSHFDFKYLSVAEKKRLFHLVMLGFIP